MPLSTQHFAALLCITCVQLSLAAPAADAVLSLPLWGKPPTPQFSGFLSAGDVEPVHLHYWFAQAEGEDHATKPVILWLNGGPGSTSVLGMLQEIGPLLINATGGLTANPYSWTREANIFIMESPSGVGYSYCEASLKGEGCNNTDKSTARANRACVQDFFKNKFPELAKNAFYITGESYAGVYVPTLSKEILDNAPEVNLKGLAVGDPCTDIETQAQSMDMLWYAHKHGFVPDAEYDFLKNNCSVTHMHPIAKGKWGTAASPDSHTGLPAGASPECVLAHRKYLLQSSDGISQTWPSAWINDLSLYSPSAVVPFTQPGSLNYMTAQYMLRPDTKAALHVAHSPTGQKDWPGPGAAWSYTSQYAACNTDYAPGTWSMVDFYRNIAPRLATTVVFNGDTDPCVSYEGTREALIKVGFAEVEGGAYRPWFFNATKDTDQFLAAKPILFGPDLTLRSAGVQYGGHVVSYEHNLHFVTVHGSGHMVPQFRPRAALHMIRKVLGSGKLSPLLASDATISGMSDTEYPAYMSKWTDSAKAAPYAN